MKAGEVGGFAQLGQQGHLEVAIVLTHRTCGRTLSCMAEGERRSWKRLEHGLRVELAVLGSRAGGALNAIGTHLSPHGLFVQLADPPAEGTRVRVTLGAGDSVRFTAEGVVTNQFAPNDASDVSGVGIALAEAGAPWRKLYEWLSQDE
ncbi:MAG: hypothetical protein GY811_30470 [Myxococcales bacterium]|nr:hypothetical protein [Myxococcales bacterium]